MEIWNLPSGPLVLSGPLFIGILNITPDSFSDGGRFCTPELALAQGRELVAAGAGMLDIGAESTRPGSSPVSPEEEWTRLEPILRALRADLPDMPLSLDTRHVITAARGLAMGVSVLNDVTGFSEPGMLAVARLSTCGLIAMRNRVKHGSIDMPDYGGPGESSVKLVICEMKETLHRLQTVGIRPERILLDPGFGFGTTYQEDSLLWNSLPGLPELLHWPAARVCIGVSRKRFLAWRNGSPQLPPSERDPLTSAAHAEAMDCGYRVFRTHDIS